MTLIEGSHGPDEPCGVCDAELIEGAPVPVTFTDLSFSAPTRAEIETSNETGSVSRVARGTSIKPLRSDPPKVFEPESTLPCLRTTFRSTRKSLKSRQGDDGLPAFQETRILSFGPSLPAY